MNCDKGGWEKQSYSKSPWTQLKLGNSIIIEEGGNASVFNKEKYMKEKF